MLRGLVVLTGCLIVAMCHPLLAGETDQDAVRRAVQVGKAVPLEVVLDRARRDHPGQVLGVELENGGGRLVYEVRILAEGGRIEDWRYDANTALPVAAQPQGNHRGEEK